MAKKVNGLHLDNMEKILIMTKKFPWNSDVSFHYLSFISCHQSFHFQALILRGYPHSLIWFTTTIGKACPCLTSHFKQHLNCLWSHKATHLKILTVISYKYFLRSNHLQCWKTSHLSRGLTFKFENQNHNHLLQWQFDLFLCVTRHHFFLRNYTLYSFCKKEQLCCFWTGTSNWRVIQCSSLLWVLWFLGSLDNSGKL